ncbi:uncharacterized protein LOC142933370 [Anarhichas minor]|uniref:uncharacterized protein LOC142933370 n=1 Tax=Anarhichas minor TaxID=65739 RepID=UPI003F7394E9
MSLTDLTRKHGVKIPPLFGCSVEGISLAVGELVGHSCVKSAARMNNAADIFLDSLEAAEVVLENGVEVGEHFLPVHPLSSPAVKVTVSNVPPFIRNDDIIGELSKHGKVVSPVKRMSSGFKSPLLKHVVSHRRHVLMIPNNRSREVNLVFKITVEDFDYVIFAKTDDFKCYSCGKDGHLSRACPGENGSHEDQNQSGTEEGRGDKQDGQEGTSGAQGVRVEETSVAQEVRVEETSVAQEVREEGTSVAQEVRVEETGGSQEVREEETSGLQEVRERTGGQVESGSEVDMEEDEEQLKAPQLKRKKGGNSGNSQAKKVATTRSIGAAECESSLEKDSAADSELSEYRAGSCKSSEGYSVEEIQDYLLRSKNVRGAKVEDYLSDKEKLLNSVRAHMRSKDRGGLTEQEGFRLKKIVQILKKELNNDGANGE